MKKKGILFAKGWQFRAPELTKKHRDYFLRKYALLPQYYQDNALYQKLTEFDRSRTTVVGVHIRRHDYRTWENGRYFYSDDVYERWMDRLAKQLKRTSRRNILFILFSDEQVTIEGRANIIVSKNPWYIDHILMSKCDYLIGPPSTFTMWASYIGNARYFHITDPAGTVDLEKFAHCRG